MKLERSSGILLHISSLPGPFGIGDLGPSAHSFCHFLKNAGFKYWQMLPVNPTDAVFHHSPYSSHSAFAGNQWLISPELLHQDGWIDLKDHPLPKLSDPDRTDYSSAEHYKRRLFDSAYDSFRRSPAKDAGFSNFCKKHAEWLDDYALFMVLREKYSRLVWTDWPAPVRDRKASRQKELRAQYAEELEKEKFIQFLFFEQWSLLMAEAHKLGISLFGDLPFYVNHDSADCWSHPKLFKLSTHKQPTHVSGVPPDYFSKTGQLWGTPVFNWKELRKTNYHWWLKRLEQNMLLFDLVRLDHFRAFSAYWEVDASAENAINGKWKKAPGKDFFKILQKKFPDMPFVAEDLGSIDKAVEELLLLFDFPGMKVLQFAFGEEGRDNPYLPFNHRPNSVVYTGTHDNSTTKAWFKELEPDTKKHIENYLGKKITQADIAENMVRLALQSVSELAVVPLQDLLALGEEGLMNRPGSTSGNWSWRVTKEQLELLNEKELRELNQVYGRNVKE